ncbi:T-cell surface glycoprotein CD3 zeta chain-like [Plectropomus leopardus]|uniref:T-cell surface glycoprotein CD3 zeta chain-like n=1 Tax=Plectropomus leopardus TaxID=160734 RepID=UPI001C4D4AD9|nr:T-cell surface glycoprotein CD3 zeta chain-like [Plectropomus leopardus]
MDPQTWMCGVLLLAAVFPPTAAGSMYDPQVCYVLDGFLGLYGLIITGMFIKEKFFRPKGKPTEESLYSDLRGQDTGGYAPLMRDPERARNRRMADDDSTYTHLNKSSEGEYKELPVNKRERQRKNEKVYQDLSSATRDTYDSLQMQPLSR